jgi:hypothetical protein
VTVAVRVIPCLDVDGGRVVKGVNFRELRDAGDPVELAAFYDAEGADELTFLDITASSGGRDTMYDVVRRTAEQVFIPLTVGGGVRSVADVDRLLRAGADKVSLNTAAVARPEHPLAAHKAALPRITITMNGKKITVSGALQSGGVRIVSKVTHEAQGDPTLVRLDPGVTVAQLLKAAAGDPNNIALIASIVFSPQANKGTSAAQAHLAPGRYVAIDLASNAKNPPLTTFTIAKAAAPARLPKPQATISAIEFGFRGPSTLHDGELVRFQNDGFLVHMIIGLRARNAADARQIAKLLLAGKDAKTGPFTVGFEGFMSPVSSGAVQQQELHVKPGSYVLACFMTTQDGREHTQLGMVRVVKVVGAT